LDGLTARLEAVPFQNEARSNRSEAPSNQRGTI
jgi:hypothetical protein